MPDGVYLLDDETDKALASIQGNNVNINPNINLPNSLGKAVNSLGIGGAIAAGMTAGSSMVKSGASAGIKLGVVAVGGAIGGTLFVSTNYMNTIAQKRAKCNSSSNSSTFSAKSVMDNNDDQFLNAVLGLLDANIILHICILYLLIALALLYISNNFANNKLKTDFLKNIFGVRFYNIVVKLLNYTNKTNKIWMIVIWVLLLIASLATIYISYYILFHIDVISEIYQNSKK